MSIITIHHRRTEPFFTCGEVDICRIELVATGYIMKARRGRDVIHIQREGAENTAGFVVKFDKEIRGKKTFTAAPGEDRISPIIVPSNQDKGDYKYTVYYPDDTAKVVPLDPIIIIQPRNMSFSFGFITTATATATGAIAFVAGAAASMLLGWKWF